MPYSVHFFRWARERVGAMSDTDGNSEGTNNAFDGGSEVSSPPPASEAPVSSPSSSNGGGGGQVRRSTICAICSEDTGNYHLNYGASACYSCRAFFRRAIQKDRNPQFICKRGQSEHEKSLKY